MKKSTTWIILFFAIFLLSQDYFSWFAPVKLIIGGFPNWVVWVVILQLIFVGAIYLFNKYYWKNEESNG